MSADPTTAVGATVHTWNPSQPVHAHHPAPPDAPPSGPAPAPDDSRNAFIQHTTVIKRGHVAAVNLRILGGLDDASLLMVEKTFVTDPDAAGLKLGLDALTDDDTRRYAAEKIGGGEDGGGPGGQG